MKNAIENLRSKGPNWAQRARALEYFLSRDFRDYQAAGLIGNFVVETGSRELPAGQTQYGGGPGRGIAQWEKGGGRFEELERFATLRGKRWDDFEVQLEFVAHEFDTTEALALEALLGTASVEEAAEAVVRYYERPSVPHLAKRIKESRLILDAYREELRRID